MLRRSSCGREVLTKRVVAVSLLALFAALAWAAPGARAQTGIDVRSSDATSNFPDGFTFSLEVAGANIDDVRLIYEIAPDGVRTTAEADCTGASAMSCTYSLVASRTNVIIPGAVATYFWRITTGGETTETDPQVVTYEDNRFEWHTISDGNLTLWWYSGSEYQANAVLAAGRESLDANAALLQTQVDIPVKIFWYASAEDMAPAILPSQAAGVVTAGEVVYSDTAMVSGSGAEDIARHEIAHVVVRQAIGPIYSVPDWLNEGLAVYSQSAPFSEQQASLDQAIQSGDVLSVRSLSSASSGAVASKVSLFYGQSYSLVDFLISTYGKEKFAKLFKAFSQGATTAEALEQAYGFDQDGLENEWRASVGLPPRAALTPAAEGSPTATANPTPTPNASTSSDDGGAPIALVIAIVALVVVLVGVFAAIGVLLSRRYR
ncbi:MAG: peptidase MA family metallohydrolase [Dehalococcoidia bacterium]